MGSAPLLLHPSLLCLTGDVSEAGEELGAFPSLIPQTGLCWGQSCPLCPIVLAIPAGCAAPEPGPGGTCVPPPASAVGSAAPPAPSAGPHPNAAPTSPDNAALEMLRKPDLLLCSCHHRGDAHSSQQQSTPMASPLLAHLSWSQLASILLPPSLLPGIRPGEAKEATKDAREGKRREASHQACY